jgi:hypothetical protein
VAAIATASRANRRREIFGERLANRSFSGGKALPGSRVRMPVMVPHVELIVNVNLRGVGKA